MIYGAITNSWRNQLDDADLGDLVAEARQRGAKHVELRQTCLAAADTGEGDQWRPNLEALANVVVRFPSLEDAERCYHSEAYQEALSFARNASERDLCIIEGS